MADYRKKSKKSAHIGSILSDLLTTLRPEANGGLVRVWQLWDEVVGRAIAENARPAAFKGKLLLVHVASSPWIHQLQFLKGEIIQKLNAELGQDLIEDIKFKIGPV
jgi:predicted nucleic acid-binding Zn ribbon protein